MITRTKKHFKIYKFNFTCSELRSKNEERLRLLRWERAKELSDFKHKLIDTLCPEKFDELIKYTPWAKVMKIEPVEYTGHQYGGHIFDQFEIGMDMLYKKYNMYHEYHWRSLYFLVPHEQAELIEYFEKNKPSWVTNVKRI